jgi:hypothetical protein
MIILIKRRKKDKVFVIQNEAKQSEESLDLGKFAGKYKLELFNIEGKDTIKTEKIFEVFDKSKLSENQKPFLKVLLKKLNTKEPKKQNSTFILPFQMLW